ncbi:arabinan endo-1,5-alpha-L-arabinosidase [Planctomonas psychrotolerans]|uniref:arabinan endo-1,5-alpha-L-arabinosidase n=1 Tax=Planctomonas psychrotolerans TaxID=2528712 RepID=UPI001D0D4882|nr:arabinan endo-1,5-alpha-L-arabinosidase [Planctomonas psychrotolerans]
MTLESTEVDGASATPADPSTWGARHAHDPTVVRGDDGIWYMFSTDSGPDRDTMPTGVHVRTSTDLVTWTFAGTALPGVPRPAADWANARMLWAPEVMRWPGADPRWHMYYSASTFGSRTSAIGLAVASDLAGPWEDRGIVVATRTDEDTQNAIDANITFDRDGAPWLTYGSFFSGIYTLPLRRDSGEPLEPGDHGTVIARRPRSVDGAIEGAFVLHRRQEDRFVLFASYDSLFSTYNVRVAVADAITGPYRDANGRDMADLGSAPHAIGTKVLGSYRFDGDTGWLAPGHNSILVEPTDTGDEYFMVHHVRVEGNPTEHTAHVRRVFFTAAGWPVVSPQPFAGRDSEALPATEPLDGTWRVVRFDPESSELVPARPVHLESPAGEPGRRFGTAAEQARIRVDGVDLDAVVFGSADASRGRAALSFSGMGSDGVVWFGTKGD